MLRIITICLFLCGLSFSCAEVKKMHHTRSSTSAIPRLNILNDTTATALKISSLDIKTVVAANIGTTTFDISFFNPNAKILEGEFEFPLADGQTITRYALDMNGHLREGVVVEKAKARVAFEATVRKGIDPGLVEKTKGNNFRTRIFPIPANGYRHILIVVEQTLEQVNKDLFYQLPLYAKDPIDTFSINVTVLKSPVKPQLSDSCMAGLEFSKEKSSYVAEHHQKNFTADQTVEFSLPASNGDDDIVITENYNDQTYFYINSRVEPQHKDKRKPTRIGLLWDISASGEKRNIKKECDLLNQYLSGVGNVKVSLVPFNISMQATEEFGVNSGNADALTRRLGTMVYDGGTQFGAIDLTKYDFDEVLLFSDGLSTFGKHDIILSNAPVITITTSPSADYSYLKYIAQQSHGHFIDLGKLEPATALKEMNGESLQITGISYDHSEIEDLATPITPILNSGLSLSGKLKTSSANIKVELGFGNETVITKNFIIRKSSESDFDQIKRVWATMMIDRLDLEFESNRQEITQLGKEFSVVTQNTSLIVLDRVEDYVEHEIVPPAELQKEYYVLLKEKQASEKGEKSTAFSQAVEAMTRLKDWWQMDFPGKKNVDPIVVPEPIISTDTLYYTSVQEAPRDQSNSVAMRREELVDSGRVGVGSANSLSYNYTSLSRVAYEDITFSYKIGDLLKENEKSEPGIDLKEWKSDASYLKSLEQTSPGARREKYLSLKKQYSDQPSFFVDVARFFISKNEKQAGLLVLSNISEMKLEDAELLRIVATQLMDATERELAIVTFEEILKMREEDPQSYRDLALAYNETGEYNKAIELLYKLVLGTWDSRFGDVKAIALNEMNAIISAHPGMSETATIDKQFIYAMPVDVRIVIGWNTDNSDIDLWVTDPNKEKCFYEHTDTNIGGKISQDVTQGYGPEEFCLKKARNGNYIVDVNLYGDHRQNLGGPISIKADLFTDFGRPTQKRKTINLRVTTDKEVINLGSLKFGS